MGCTVCGLPWLLVLHCHPLWCAVRVCTHCNPADLGSQVPEIKGRCGPNGEMLQNILILQRLPLWDTSHSYFTGCRRKECCIMYTAWAQTLPSVLTGIEANGLSGRIPLRIWNGNVSSLFIICEITCFAVCREMALTALVEHRLDLPDSGIWLNLQVTPQ